MKIAIVTQSLLGNYGGILQNYALQTVLKRMKHSVVTVDYTLKNSLWRYFRHYIKYSIRKITGKLHPTEVPPTRYRTRTKQIDSFVQKHITLTPKVDRYTPDLLESEKVQAVIVGSDQVWRPRYNQYLEDMFLRFTKNLSLKRIAYAASFGVDHWEFSKEQTYNCRKLAALFDAASVREESGILLCKEKLGINAVSVLDPTLLLHADDYAKLCENIPTAKEPFLVAYFLHSHHKKEVKAKYELAQKIAQQKNLTLRILEADNAQSIPIEEWLATFRDASMVITESFHGTVFSIINHREFISIGNKNRGIARLSTLLGTLGLEKRLVSASTFDDATLSLPPIDYENVDNCLDSLRKQSYDFLRHALTE